MKPSIYVCMTACHMFQCQAVVWCNDGLSILIGNLRKQTVKFLSKYGGFHSSKCIWKYSPQNCVHFVSASTHLITWWLTAHIFSYHWNLILIIMSRVADCRGADLCRHWWHRGLSLWWPAMSPVSARFWHSGGCCLSDLIEADHHIWPIFMDIWCKRRVYMYACCALYICSIAFYILHSCSKLESSHLINYPFIMTQLVCALKSIMVFGQWLVAHAAPNHCVKPGLISHQYIHLKFHKQGSWLRESRGTQLIMYDCWALYRCLGGELWYLQHNCVGDAMVCH